MHIRPFTLLLVLIGLTVPASAAEDWLVTSADFRTEAVNLLSVEPAGVRVKNAAGVELVLKPDAFLRIERADAPAIAAEAGAFLLHLAGGEQLGGTPLSMTGDQITWKNASVGELAVPMSRLLAMTRPGKPPAQTRATEDIVVLSNGDTVRGIINGVADGKFEVKNAAGDVVPVPMESIDSVQFASTPGAGGGDKEQGYRLQFTDGSTLSAASVKLNGDNLEFTLAKTEPARSIPLASVVGIEQVNGPAVFLSTREPVENVYVPFFGSDQDYPARMNQTVDGSADLRFGTQIFRRAIGVHSFSRLSWTLDGSFPAFRTQYGIDANRRGADVTVRVLLDDKVVHEKKNVVAGMLSPVIAIDLAGAKKLTLEVDYGENLHVNDHLTWLEPALLRLKPAATPTPTTAPAPR